MALLIDTHAHLYAEEFDVDRDVVIQNALSAGVSKIFLPNVDSVSIPRMLALEQVYPEVCIPMMGLHPCYVKENFQLELETMSAWLAQRHFAAIGEIGMDLYWDISFKSQQEEALAVQLAWAEKYGLPVVIHCRSSIEETLAIIRREQRKVVGIFHCFSGSLKQAEEVVELGFSLGIGGVVTFKNGGLEKILPAIGLDHVVLETDAPYLAPIPYRGKRNESSYLTLIAMRVADLYQMSLEDVAQITTNNALAIFK